MPKKSAAASVPQDYAAMIAETAYYMAEKRGFAPGHDVADWLAAEREVEAILTGQALRKTPAKKAAASRSKRSTA